MVEFLTVTDYREKAKSSTQAKATIKTAAPAMMAKSEGSSMGAGFKSM